MSKLHLVFGGRVSDPRGLDFTDLKNVDLVGLFDSYAEAEDAWQRDVVVPVMEDLRVGPARRAGANADRGNEIGATNIGEARPAGRIDRRQ